MGISASPIYVKSSSVLHLFHITKMETLGMHNFLIMKKLFVCGTCDEKEMENIENYQPYNSF